MIKQTIRSLSKKKICALVVLAVLVIFVLVGLYNIYKPLPDGLSTSGEIFNVPDSSVKFLSDLTYVDSDSNYVSEQRIFDEVFAMIDQAENFILLDMFLYNDFTGKEKGAYKSISHDLTQVLIDKKSGDPSAQILVITDSINTIYGGIESENFNRLHEAGISVVETNLRKLRDSNPIYSSVWRSALRFLPFNFIKLPNPFVDKGPKVGLGIYLELLNFKANHRKVIVTDYLDEAGELKVATLVTSANPHDGSSRHSNVAIRIGDFIWQDVLKSELAVADFSGDADFQVNHDQYQNETGDVKVQLLTEKEIKNSLLHSINQTEPGDNIKMLMFYLSDRGIIKALKRAHERGVNVQIVLDPNKDAFGREKNGVPNVSVAREFKKLDPNFQLRWCNTNGEQCHSKMIIIEKKNEQHDEGQNKHQLFIGSANLTKRNIHDYNLETNIKIWGESVTAIDNSLALFNNIWHNDPHQFSVDYDVYQDESLLKYLQYRIMEKTGLSSF